MGIIKDEIEGEGKGVERIESIESGKRLFTNKIINDIGIRHTVDKHVVIA